MAGVFCVFLKKSLYRYILKYSEMEFFLKFLANKKDPKECGTETQEEGDMGIYVYV